jgi:diaminopimelate decarboxylase
MISSSPLTSETSDRDRLHAADVYGTPLFYYSLATLRQQIARLARAVSKHPARLLFATMANDRSEVLSTIADAGVGACVNSIPHLQRAFAEGFMPEDIQFTSCGLPIADMAYLQSLDIVANLDSPSQIQAWCGLRKDVAAGARINAASLTGSPAPPDRIGMSLEDFRRARVIAQQLGGRINGVHVYAGTNFQRAADMLPILRGIFALARDYSELEYVNIGGGIGVDYSHSAEPFDYEAFGREVCALALQTEQQRGRTLRVLFEPGRSLVASSAEFITCVTDIKHLHGTRYVVVDASVSLFPRPYHHPGNWHQVRVLDGTSTTDAGATAPELLPSTVVGRTTFSRDILGQYNLPASLAVGSYLAFADAGAYCESMSSRFLGQRDPICYIAKD